MGREKKNVTENPESHGQIATNRRGFARPLALRGRPMAGTTLAHCEPTEDTWNSRKISGSISQGTGWNEG